MNDEEYSISNLNIYQRNMIAPANHQPNWLQNQPLSKPISEEPENSIKSVRDAIKLINYDGKLYSTKENMSWNWLFLFTD